MGRSNETFNKKEKEKQRLKKQQEKKAKAEDRKANSTKGKGLEDMMAYLDENGNITSTPPAFSKPRSVELSEIMVATPKKVDDPEDLINHGVITFYNTSKGFGFIRDAKTRENIFFHVNQLTFQAKENDQVTFLTEKGPKGLNAINVSKAG